MQVVAIILCKLCQFCCASCGKMACAKYSHLPELSLKGGSHIIREKYFLFLSGNSLLKIFLLPLFKAIALSRCMKPMLTILIDGQHGFVCCGKSCDRLPRGQIIMPRIQNGSGCFPSGKGVLPYPAEIRPRKRLSKVRRDFALCVQFFFGGTCPAHHVKNQPFHIHNGRYKQCLFYLFFAERQHRKIGTDAVCPQADFLPVCFPFCQNFLQLRHHRPRVKTGCHGLARPVLRQVDAQNLIPGRNSNPAKAAASSLLPPCP